MLSYCSKTPLRNAMKCPTQFMNGVRMTHPEYMMLLVAVMLGIAPVEGCAGDTGSLPSTSRMDTAGGALSPGGKSLCMRLQDPFLESSGLGRSGIQSTHVSCVKQVLFFPNSTAHPRIQELKLTAQVGVTPSFCQPGDDHSPE